MISHIKGTLIQFLKNIPLTDSKNEELLKIIYSMMEFTPTEMTELYNNRVAVKVNSKQKTPSNHGTLNTSNSLTTSTEEVKLNAPPKKTGFTSWFGGGKKDTANTSAGLPSPKPQPRK